MMRLLLVEDDTALREILEKRLAQEGYAVDTCGDGNEGLDYALSAPYGGKRQRAGFLRRGHYIV